VVLGAVISGGRSHGYVAAWAHAAGVGLYAALTVFGISALITLVPWLFRAVQIAGAVYLLWLAAKLLRSPGAPPDSATRQPATRTAAVARDGFAVAFLNPKLAVFMLALFSQFIKPGASATTSALLIATATLIDGLWYTAVSALVGQERWLKALRARAGLIDRLFGVLLATVAVSILWLALRSFTQ
jgi:threonine/homoserine/homoserine lactone efflux protein